MDRRLKIYREQNPVGNSVQDLFGKLISKENVLTVNISENQSDVLLNKM